MDAYLRDVLQRLPTHLNSRVDELLPHRWQPMARASVITSSRTVCAQRQDGVASRIHWPCSDGSSGCSVCRAPSALRLRDSLLNVAEARPSVRATS